jgi:hypothetical protein
MTMRDRLLGTSPRRPTVARAILPPRAVSVSNTSRTTVGVFGFIVFAWARRFSCRCSLSGLTADYLKGLVVIKARVRLQGRIGLRLHPHLRYKIAFAIQNPGTGAQGGATGGSRSRFPTIVVPQQSDRAMPATPRSRLALVP